MTDAIPTPPELDPVTVTARANGHGLTVADVTGLVGLFAGMLADMEKRILGRLDENSHGATERWRLHDREAERIWSEVRGEVGAVRDALTLTTKTLTDHLEKEKIEEERNDARVAPLKFGIVWAVANWRQIIVFLFALLGFFAVGADVLSRYIPGLVAPG